MDTVVGFVVYNRVERITLRKMNGEDFAVCWNKYCWLPEEPASNVLIYSFRTDNNMTASTFKMLGNIFFNLIFVVPSIMLYSSEISATRCNNCRPKHV